MGYSTALYLKFPVSPILVGLWCIAAQFILYSPSGISTNHSSINYLIFNSLIASLSFFLFYKKNFLLLLVGFFFTSLIFVLITSTIFIIPLVIFLYLNNKKEFWTQIIWFGLGSLLMLSIYFIFFQRPQEFFYGTIKAIEVLKYVDTHGSSALIVWHKKIIAKILMVLPFILIFSIKFFSQWWLRALFIILSFLYISYFVYPSFIYRSSIVPNLIYYFLAVIIFIESFKNISSIKFYYLILILMVPYFASIGTESDFFIKSVVYFPFILIAALYSAFQLNAKYGKLLLISFIGITMISVFTFFTYPFRYTWNGEYKAIEQKIEYEFKGATLYFDSEKARKLNEAKPFITGEKYVLASHPNLWGYVLILNAEPLLIYYKYNDYVLRYIEENKIPKQKLLLLDYHDHPFDKEVIQTILGNEFVLKKIELSDFNIYTIETPDNL